MSTPRPPAVPALFAPIALACSWTWVIGMVFPAFMVADFGWPGWVVFVVPNAIGAASVGFLLRSRAQTEEFVRTHRVAIRFFTYATVAFHGFVLVSLLPAVGWLDPMGKAFAVVCGLAIVVAALARRSLTWIVKASVGVMSVSLACFVLGGIFSEWEAYTTPSVSGGFPFPTVVLALAGTTLGFLTCPVLDATFLRVRAELDTPARSRAAFAVAFSGPFLILVGMTALYGAGLFGPGMSSHYILLHIAVQSLYTCSFHARVHRTDPGAGPLDGLTPAIALVIGGALALAWPAIGDFRLGYELFLSLYALPFPAYVWIVCVWGKRPDKRSLAVLGIAVLAASPLFWMGYVMSVWALVPLGVAVVVGAPALLWARRAGERSSGG
ncbi:MAG: hypothetical protein AAGH64_03900 [Planctomycetota bacterium]